MGTTPEYTCPHNTRPSNCPALAVSRETQKPPFSAAPTGIASHAADRPPTIRRQSIDRPQRHTEACPRPTCRGDCQQDVVVSLHAHHVGTGAILGAAPCSDHAGQWQADCRGLGLSGPHRRRCHIDTASPRYRPDPPTSGTDLGRALVPCEHIPVASSKTPPSSRTARDSIRPLRAAAWRLRTDQPGGRPPSTTHAGVRPGSAG